MITVITAFTKGYDKLGKQIEYPGVEYLNFIDTCMKFTNPTMNARMYKMLSHKFTDSPYIVWVDGNVTLKRDPQELVEIMGDKDFAFFKHPRGGCLYREARMCLKLKKENADVIKEQVEAYKRKGFPHHAGLCETGVFVRRNNQKANTMFERWWAELTRYSNRDQISFPYVFRDQEWATIPGSIRGENDYITYVTHK